jgi:hypothetical protein
MRSAGPERALSRKQKSLPYLVETRATRDISRLELWAWAFGAIANDVLRLDLPEGQSLDSKFDIGGMLMLERSGNGVVTGCPWTLRKILREASREIERYIPLLEKWAKTLMFDTTEFDNWLQRELLAHQMPASPKRSGGRRKTKLPSVEKYRAGRPPDADYDREDLRQFIYQKLEEKGGWFQDDLAGWQTQADLHKLIRDYYCRRGKKIPANSSLYRLVRPILDEWRKKPLISEN